MPWTDITRTEHDRSFERHPSDMSDAEWAVVAPLVPPARPGGRPRGMDMREVMNAIVHVASGGIAWRMLPKDFPPVSTVRGHFHAWRNDGTLSVMNCALVQAALVQAALVQAARELEGKEPCPSPCPSAGIMDSQGVKTTEGGGACGFDAGKGIKGRKRHIVTDTNGLVVGLVVHGAAVQDRDGAVPTLRSIRRFHLFLRHVFADGGYSGGKLEGMLNGKGGWTIEVIRRSDSTRGFKVLPRRWVVERTFAWLGRCRRLAKDWEATIESSTAWTLIAHIRILVRRPARYCCV